MELVENARFWKSLQEFKDVDGSVPLDKRDKLFLYAVEKGGDNMRTVAAGSGRAHGGNSNCCTVSATPRGILCPEPGA